MALSGEKKKEYMREYRRKNREKHKEYMRKVRERPKDSCERPVSDPVRDPVKNDSNPKIDGIKRESSNPIIAELQKAILNQEGRKRVFGEREVKTFSIPKKEVFVDDVQYVEDPF